MNKLILLIGIFGVLISSVLASKCQKDVSTQKLNN